MTDVAAPPQGPKATGKVLSERTGQAPQVTGVVYPRPDHEGNPWSQWGQGIVLSDGRFLSAIGDHLGVDGNSYLYVFDPDTQELTRFSDVASPIGHRAGEFGYGKVHAQMVQPNCDEVVVATYWGTRRGLTYEGGYTGDHLLSVNTQTLEVTDLGVPVASRGITSLGGHGDLVYGEAVDPEGRPGGDKADTGTFFAYDTRTRNVTFSADDPRHIGFRSMAVDGTGRAYLAMKDGGLLRYEPGSGLTPHEDRLPAGWLRASTAPAADGTVYAVTREPERYVAIRSDGSIDDLGAASGYIASVALSADETELFVVPGAHGDAWKQGTPLLAVDVATGREREVVKLAPVVEKGLGLTPGGSYNVAVDGSSGRVFVGLNAGTTSNEPWGEVVLVTVEP
ncbi:hypothetical protein [Granulicoccus sp. GXG6511]|uniref:hypothetical protein n=1 Tax=Granulicoccus sp. GXG6511 TaxID=3381351 RepID=UPI003D7EC537